MPINLSRRRVLSSLALLTMGHLIPNLAFADIQKNFEVTASFDVFMRLSRFITQTDQLGMETGRKIYSHILNEPWGKEHVQQIVGRWNELQAEYPSAVTLEQLLATRHFQSEAAKGERWFIGHLLTTWFTGIYYHQSGNHVITYQGALMHKVLEDVRPIPGSCVDPFGYWAEPPQGYKG